MASCIRVLNVLDQDTVFKGFKCSQDLFSHIRATFCGAMNNPCHKIQDDGELRPSETDKSA